MKTQLLSTVVFSSSEIHIHYKQPLFSSMKNISCAEGTQRIIQSFLNPDILYAKEYFYVMPLNNSNRLLEISLISTGVISSTVVNIKEIFQLSLLSYVATVIIVHNHVSGKLNPSTSNLRVVEKIAHRLSVFGFKTLRSHYYLKHHFTSFFNVHFWE